MEKEIRNIGEIRANAESRNVDGYALVFNSLSEDLGGFREQILPEAVEGVIERSDVMATLNHDATRESWQEAGMVQELSLLKLTKRVFAIPSTHLTLPLATSALNISAGGTSTSHLSHSQ